MYYLILNINWNTMGLFILSNLTIPLSDVCKQEKVHICDQ